MLKRSALAVACAATLILGTSCGRDVPETRVDSVATPPTTEVRYIGEPVAPTLEPTTVAPSTSTTSTSTTLPPTTAAPTTQPAPPPTPAPTLPPTTLPPTTLAPAPTAPPAITTAPSGSIEAIIYAAAAEFGVSGDWMLCVARRESGLNPSAVNPTSGALGLAQHLPQYWAARAAALGYGYDSWSDPVANARVSAHLAATSGTFHWNGSGC